MTFIHILRREFLRLIIIADCPFPFIYSLMPCNQRHSWGGWHGRPGRRSPKSGEINILNEKKGYSLFWDVTQRRLVVSYPSFGTTYRSHLQGSNRPRRMPGQILSYWAKRKVIQCDCDFLKFIIRVRGGQCDYSPQALKAQLRHCL